MISLRRLTNCKRKREQKGVTLIELMMVVVVVAILSMIAGPSFTAMIAQQKLRDATSALTESFWLARSEAVTRNTDISFAFTSIGAGWSVNVVSSSTTIQTQDAIPSITSAGRTYSFNAFGRLTGSGNLEVTHSGTNLKRCLTVTTAGKVNYTDGACA